MIHVCYGMRDESGKYSKFVGTSMLSLLENTKSEVTIHLIHDSTLSVENRSRFIEIVDRFNQQIIFYNVDDLAADSIRYAETKLPETKNFRGTIAAMYRLLIPDLLPNEFEKIIYLDADTIINLDIAKLWNIDLKNFPIAATPHFFAFPDLGIIQNSIQIDSDKIDPHDYFNSGVLIFDLNKIKKLFNTKGKLLNSCVDILLKNPRNNSLDQDALNILFKNNFFKLPSKFNRLVSWINLTSDYKNIHGIYHYVGNTLDANFQLPTNRIWFEYFFKTPFATPGSFGNLFESFTQTILVCQQFVENSCNIFRRMIKASANRRRVFFVSPKDQTLIFEEFGHRDDDIIIDATRDDALQIIIQMFEKFRDYIVVLICTSRSKFYDIHDHLSSIGLIENVDFFNGVELISTQQIHADFNRIVRDM